MNGKEYDVCDMPLLQLDFFLRVEELTPFATVPVSEKATAATSLSPLLLVSDVVTGNGNEWAGNESGRSAAQLTAIPDM